MAEQEEMKMRKAAEEAAQREARNREEEEAGLKAVKEEELDHECLEKLEPKILS
jgi:hypothetical protein